MNAMNNYYEFGNTKNPKQIIILLHGLGSNGRDLIELSPMWAPDLPDALFVSPDAPFPCDMGPMGFQWFSLQDRRPSVIQSGIEVAFPLLSDFITAQCQRFDLPLSSVALVGFSQGTMMSLYTAPRLTGKIAGVLGYSGALFGEDEMAQKPEDFHKPPIRLIHGEADDVVDVSAHHHASKVLSGLGFDVSGHTTPHLTHSIDQQGVDSAAAFFKDIFA